MPRTAAKPAAPDRAAAPKKREAGAPAPAGPSTIESPLRFGDAAAFDAWLVAHHDRSDGEWLCLAKAGNAGLAYDHAVEVALCHGWIDSQKRSFDAEVFLMRFTPRRGRSLWSKINRGKAEGLMAAGRMRPAGLAQVEAARADGRWDAAYDGARNAEVPPDLRAALDALPAAAAFFETLNAANRYAVLWRVQTAVKPETRARRIAQLVAMLGRGEKIH